MKYFLIIMLVMGFGCSEEGSKKRVASGKTDTKYVGKNSRSSDSKNGPETDEDTSYLESGADAEKNKSADEGTETEPSESTAKSDTDEELDQDGDLAKAPPPVEAPPQQEPPAPANEPEVNAAGEVVFRIAAATGQGAWNTPENPIVIKQGQTLRLYNDDSVNHTIHTNSQRNGFPVHGCTNNFNTRNISGDNGVACKFGAAPLGMLPEDQIHDHFTWQRAQTGTGRGAVYIKVVP